MKVTQSSPATAHSIAAEHPERRERKTILVCFSETEYASFWQDGRGVVEPLEALGAEFHWITLPLNPAEWEARLLELRPEAILGAWSLPPLTIELLKQLPELKYLCYFCGSVRYKIPVEFIQRGGLATNWGALASITVAECAIALMLAAARRITRYAIEMHVEQKWSGMSTPAPISLSKRRVGIHGLGAVARHCLPMLRALEMQVESWSLGVPDTAYEKLGVRKAESLEALITNNDIVIEAEALTPATQHSVSRTLLCQMKPGAIFINVGRGHVLEPGAVEALAERDDVALGLDVYTEEPLPMHNPLIGRPNVTLLPHTAGPTLDQYAQIRTRSLGFLEDFIAGRPLSESITESVYERMT